MATRAGDFRADAIAGLTVAIVALPLSMAIAIGSGLSPDKGLFTAIVGGFLISALGGSRFQIGGPAGAFIVLIASIVERQGYDGLVLATLMAGLMMMAAGFLRLGTYIKYIPFPVTVGFTAGIAVIILASQLKDLLGLDMAHEPAALLPKLRAIWASLGTLKPATVALSVLAIATIVGLRRLRPKWPGLLIAVGVDGDRSRGCSSSTSRPSARRFGGVPRTLPAPSLPPFDLAKLRAVFPDAIAIALLGAIESLLSAVVADGMSGRKHRSNCELVAQGAANMAAVIFGGMCVTGTIARTATNVRAGARSPVSGILHAAYILAVHARRRAARRLHPARQPRRRACRRRLEHGREGRVRQPAARLVGRRNGADGDVPADDLRRSHDRHRRRRDARRLPVPASHGRGGRGRRRRIAGQRGCRRRQQR